MLHLLLIKRQVQDSFLYLNFEFDICPDSYREYFYSSASLIYTNFIYMKKIIKLIFKFDV